ncbi:MAG: DUF5330 domain-containing protein [Parvibaculum sp.]
MFLVRIAFWVTVVALLLPSPDPTTTATANGDGTSLIGYADPDSYEQLELTDVAIAAMHSAEDVMTFCERNSATCDTGKAIFAHVQRQVTHYGGLAIAWAAERALDGNSPNTQDDPRDPAREASSPSASRQRGA